jgi:DNA-binding MarR family transcriptional regulator
MPLSNFPALAGRTLDDFWAKVVVTTVHWMAPAPSTPSATGSPRADPSLPYIVARLDRVLRRAIESTVDEFGVSVTQYTLLSVLAMQPDLSSAQLARRAYVSPQSMNETLLNLEKEELLKRTPDPNHGRILRARLTSKGRRLLERCDKKVALIEATMTTGMTDEQQELLRSTIMLSVRNLGGGFPERNP